MSVSSRRLSTCLLLLLFSGAMGSLCAQSSTSEIDQEQAPVTELIKSSDKQKESGAAVNSLVDELFNVRNYVGVAWSFTEFYMPDTLLSSSGRQSESFSFANSSLYANFQRPKSRFHMDYTVGYQRDKRRSDLSGISHSGSMSWSRAIRRRGSLSVTDSFAVATNDYGSSTPLSVYQFSQPYVPTQGILVDRQKVTRNVLTVDSAYQLAKRTSVGVFASDELTRYQFADFRQAHVFQLGFRADHQLTKFLAIESSYTSVINKVNPIYRGTSIERLRALTLRLRRRSLEIFSSAGLEYANNPGSRNIVADAEAGMSVGSKSSQFTLRYNHGLTSIIGTGSAVEANSVFAYFRYKLSNRFSVSTNSVYMRGATSSESLFESLSVDAGTQFALAKNLVFSVNHNYFSQRATSLVFDEPRLHRYASSATIQYALPLFRVR